MTKTKRMVYDTAEKVSKAITKEEVFNIILDASINFVPYATKGSILLVDKNGDFTYAALRGYSKEIKKMTLKKEEMYLYKINNFRETAIIVNPAQFDEDVIGEEKVNVLKKVEALDISCSLSSPIYIDGKLAGLLNIDSVNEDEIFTKEDEKTMNHIKNELELALKNFFIKEKLSYLANYDELTGLYNRRYFKNRFNSELNKIKQYNKESVLAVLDIDEFKKINDSYGHSIGDRALKIFGEQLGKNILEPNLCARISGDEFVILFIDCNRKTAIKRLEEIGFNLNKKLIDSFNLEFSYGVCSIIDGEQMSPDDIFTEADMDMYKNKKAKKEYKY
jgi:diguanylate cyclase (GGDEF)-like protein